MDNQTTALLLFSRNAPAESDHKELLSDPEKNLRLHQKLIDHAEGIAGTLRIPFFHFDETKQQGETFGHRFSNAVESVFNSGHSRVIVIGSDCPDINVLDISCAVKMLGEREMVVGPDQHGGAYLIGLSRKAFNKGSLERLPWQTPQLFTALCSSFTSCGLLQKKNDINEPRDVVHSTSPLLKNALSEIFDHSRISSKKQDFFYRSQISTSNSRRGPPLLA